MIDAKGNITGYSYNDFNLDNVRPGHFLLRYYQLFPEKKDSLALDLLMTQLENQPRTDEGVWWHKAIYARQVWLDGIFMGLPYYTLAAPWLNPEYVMEYYDDAVDQITKTDYRTYDETTRLWKHAWDETHKMFWANPETGLSRHTWARALGWFTMAMVEVLDALPEDYARREEIIALLQRAMKSVADYQDKASGVWFDVLDVDDSRNYLEATASSMFTYCMLKGWRLGYLDDTYRDTGIRAYKGLVKQFVKSNSDGTMSLTKCCSVSGLGPEDKPHRDGSFEYYISEPIRDNDAKGIGPFIWASLEMEMMGFTIQNLDTYEPAAVSSVIQNTPATASVYDLQGRKVKNQGRGIFIQNGRKFIRR
jgi:rhamnogalacturonyl hydrolase YesR